jgi:very-short-patch-repair endonuclease
MTTKANESNQHIYNERLQPFARKLRKDMTKAEACLWKYALRAGQMRGYEFRRQRPILNYIADFMCFELKLVIEVDGITHMWDETVERDCRKDAALTEAGVFVMRFTDEEVLRDIKGVIQRIEWWIEARTEAGVEKRDSSK